MARQLRIEFDGAFYHVTSRGNQRERMYFEDKDKERFSKILERTKERYGYLLHAYALMDNHYHLLIETPKANISRIMQNINTSYTVYVNRKYQRHGHLFQGRFKALIVDKDEYLVALSRYIHLNPVRAGIVRKPEESKWTSYKAYIDNASENGFVDTGDTLLCFSERKRKAMKSYRVFVEDGIEGMENPFKEAEAGLVLGCKRFKAKIERILDSLKADEELPQIRKLRKPVPVERIINCCSEHYGLRKEDLVRRRRGLMARHVAVYLSKVLGGGTNKEVGDCFCIKGTAASSVVKKIEGRLKTENRFRGQLETIKESILNGK